MLVIFILIYNGPNFDSI